MARTHSVTRRIAALAAVFTVLAATQAFTASVASAQPPRPPISGSGSTWSQNALDQWIRNVKQFGLTINYGAGGSSVGRNEFRAGVADFAVSEIEYGLTDGGVVDQRPTRGFAYMPIVAGGTAFMYNLRSGNNRITNLRLSGETVARIFSRQITVWNDPAIAGDNPGLALPARQIVPVVRSDGSGTTAQFTRWMSTRYPQIWTGGFTSIFPAGPGIEAKSGSLGVTQSVAAESAEGTITYVEYSYARNSGFPVAKVLNDAGFFVEPTAFSVAVALTRAEIREDLTSNLDAVYGGPGTDSRSYPLSSYSYMIIPTDTAPPFTAEKGGTLSEFAYYFLCEGQQQADRLGYSPLPLNLVRAGVRQAGRIPGTTNKLTEGNLTGCNNPTFDPNNPDSNLLAQQAPQPPECDRQGPLQCATGTAGAAQEATPVRPEAQGGEAGAATNGGGGAGGAGGGGPGGAAAADGTAAGADGTGGTAADGTAAAAVDPVTGLPVEGTVIDPITGEVVSANGATGGPGLASSVSGIPVSVDLPSDGQRIVLAVIAVVLLLALIVGPPLLSRNLAGRERGAR